MPSGPNCSVSSDDGFAERSRAAPPFIPHSPGVRSGKPRSPGSGRPLGGLSREPPEEKKRFSDFRRLAKPCYEKDRRAPSPAGEKTDEPVTRLGTGCFRTAASSEKEAET